MFPKRERKEEGLREVLLMAGAIRKGFFFAVCRISNSVLLSKTRHNKYL
jgi:hypothetical protein